MIGKIRLVRVLAIASFTVAPLLAQAPAVSSDSQPPQTDVFQVVVQEGTTATHFHAAADLRITNPTKDPLCANLYSYNENGKISCCASCPVAPFASLDIGSPGILLGSNSTFILSGAPRCDPARPFPQERLRTWMVLDQQGAVGFPAQSAPLDVYTLNKLKSDCATATKCSCSKM
jgi:hypothetical protein